MDRTERFYRISQLLENRRVVTKEQFLKELEVSLATFKRDLEYMRERMQVPIIWDAQLHGYRFDKETEGLKRAELPGLWFNDSEVYALLTMEHLLENMSPGLLTEHIQPLKLRIGALLDKSSHSIEDIRDKIRLLPLASRSYKLEEFETLCHALLTEQRVLIRQYSRQRGDYTEREISPQRLVHYRDNWYLDAWCHLRKGVRTFAVDTIRGAKLLNTKTRRVSKTKLDEHFKAGYGIFSGKDTKKARIKFSPERARWVSREDWHPKQESHYDSKGNYILEVPYSNEHELVMDIIKYGPDATVEAPASLKKAVKDRLQAALNNYS